ncbi:MFS transporter [Mammaliicoccus vitulinus]|uniref:MFS transporter n=1 Tax=Mammaliicoccus vitulinus TaxID=71237 RepID=UPI003F98E70F
MSKRKEYLLIIALISSIIFQPINTTMISVALSPIAESLQVSTLSVSWVVTIYLIVNAAAQPFSGKLGDIYGYRKIIFLGIILFLIGSVGGALSPNLISLIVFRGIQAFGTSMLLPNATAIMRNIVASERLGRTLGIFGMTATLGSAIGPLLGSFLIGYWDWHAIFWVNVPFLLIGLIGVLFLPEVEHKMKSSIDMLGSVYLASALTFIVLMTNGLSMQWNIVFLIAAILSAVLFIYREKNIQYPLVDFSLFKNKTFSISNFAGLLIGFIMYSILLITPMALEKWGNSIAQVGKIMVTFSLAFALFSAVGGRLVDWLGRKTTIFLSFVFCSIAMIGYLGMMTIHASWYQILVLLIAGFGVGIGMPAIQVAALQTVQHDLAGIATGIFSTFRYIGQIMATTLIGILAVSPSTFVIVLVVSVIGIIASLGIQKENRPTVSN